MARSEVVEIIEKVRRQVLDSQRTEVNTLSGLMADDDDDVIVDLTYALSDSLIVGSLISIGKEDMRVMAIDAANLQLTVIRGWGDSDVEMHDPDDVVWIMPRFSSQDIVDALRDEITGWGPGLYRVVDATHDVGDAAQTFELPITYAGMYGVIDVRRYVTPLSGTDPLSVITAWPRVEVRFQRGTASWDGATTSGLLLRFFEPVSASSVYVVAALPFDTDAFDDDGADLISDVGLSASMLDLAALGAKMRLMVDAEAGRSSRQTAEDPRRAEEVPPAAALQSANAYQALYRRRMSEEIAKLHTLYPIRVT